MTGIIGPSGSGKLTLLYCLAGQEKATSGTVRLLSKHMTRLGLSAMNKFRRQHLGFVFPSYNLITSMTVAQNSALPFTLREFFLKVLWPDRSEKEKRQSAVLRRTAACCPDSRPAIRRRRSICRRTDWRNYGEMNVKLRDKHGDTTYDQASNLFVESHKEVMALAQSFTNEQLFCSPWALSCGPETRPWALPSSLRPPAIMTGP